MKMGLEGTPEEIKNYMANFGFKPDDLLSIQPGPPSSRLLWLIIPLSSFAIYLVFLIIMGHIGFSAPWLLLPGIGLMGWGVLVYNQRFDKGTTLLIIFMLALLLGASGMFPARDLLKELWEKISVN